MRADFLASKKSPWTYSIYYFVISALPFVFAKTEHGVNSWTEYLKLVSSPIWPKYANASGDILMLSVEALIANIFINYSSPYVVVLIIKSLSSRSTGIPWGDTISVPLIVQIPLFVAKTTMGAKVD